mmetsp:Transcript_13483/g.21262  ORF Transcript_13483/g.21262 Transcript_13483/m.21262 type:complete len:94 (-) Transcript_13483:599-880(-)
MVTTTLLKYCNITDIKLHRRMILPNHCWSSFSIITTRHHCWSSFSIITTHHHSPHIEPDHHLLFCHLPHHLMMTKTHGNVKQKVIVNFDGPNC